MERPPLDVLKEANRKSTQSKHWTMNCVIAGARAFQLLKSGNEEGARKLLTQLTSELTPEDVDYLAYRLKR